MTLAGGDVAQSPSGILTDIVVVGSVPKGKAVLRSGAKPGDRIYVTGELGGSAAALKLLFAGRKLRPADFPHHFHPQPRLAVGEFLRQKRLASAMIDISDGLSTDLAHICEESGVGAEIQADAIPLANIGKPGRPVDLNSALHGGEDYELLFTAPRERQSEIERRLKGLDCPVACIGSVDAQPGLRCLEASGHGLTLTETGYTHF